MAFERVEVGPETARKNGGRTAGPDRREQLVETIRRWLGAGLVLIEVSRHQGRGGYVPALRYELHDEGLADVEGVTVRGVNPFVFVDNVIRDVVEHAAERGNAAYQMVGHHTVGEGDDLELKRAFTFTIPKSWIGEVPDGDDAAGGESQVSTLLGGWKLLVDAQQKYIGELHKTSVAKDQGTAEVIKANAQSLLANAENIGKHAPAVELELAKLQMERDAIKTEVDARIHAARQERNARVAERLIEVLGPDIVSAIRTVLARWGGVGESTTEAASSAHARELASILAACTSEQRAKLAEAFGPDAWSVIESAANAESDETFAAQWAKLNEIIGSWSKAEQTKVLTAVAVTIGDDLSRRLMELFKSVR